MGVLFLSSRTEIVRSLYLEYTRKVLIVGSPPYFTEWLEKILPTSTLIHGSMEEVPSSKRDLDLIIWWLEENKPSDREKKIFEGLSAPNSDLWIVTRRETDPADLWPAQEFADPENIPDPLFLTAEIKLHPVIIRWKRELDSMSF